MNTKEVAKISGVSVRTLHHFDNIGLLVPKRNPDNDYREYSPEDLDRLQQILFFRECGFALTEISKILESDDFDKEKAFKIQRELLKGQRNHIDNMLKTIDQSLKELKGELIMSNEEKFAAFKDGLIKENLDKYGSELEQLYGKEQIEKTNHHIRELTRESYNEIDTLNKEILSLISKDNPSENDMRLLAESHQKWLKAMWGSSVEYSKEAHLNLIDMYLADPRFQDYYGGKKNVDTLKKAVEKYL